MTTRLMPLLLVATLALSGCAKPDWIQQTLVTVDVTGTWRSTEGGPVELVLEQQGSKVTGAISAKGNVWAGSASGMIDDIVAGDMFRFTGPRGGQIAFEGELTVSGDEMAGKIHQSGYPANRSGIRLERINSSPRPSSQP